MTSRYGLIIAIALAARAAAPGLAQADVLSPPPDGSDASAAVETDDEALAALHQDGVAQIRTLGHIGDYWEGEGFVRGKPVVAFIYADGALRIEPASPGDRVQSAELPE